MKSILTHYWLLIVLDWGFFCIVLFLTACQPMTKKIYQHLLNMQYNKYVVCVCVTWIRQACYKACNTAHSLHVTFDPPLTLKVSHYVQWSSLEEDHVTFYTQTANITEIHAVGWKILKVNTCLLLMQWLYDAMSRMILCRLLNSELRKPSYNINILYLFIGAGELWVLTFIHMQQQRN